MPKSRTTRRKSYSYKPVRKRSTPASRAKRAAHRRVKVFKLWRKRLLVAAIAILCLPVVARVYVHYSAHERVYANINDVPRCRVALVLGAGVNPDGSLSRSLASRVDKAVELWREGKCEKLLMSGDNRVKHYNEPERMRDYAVNKGVNPSAIALDYAGRRTYDSIYRAKNIFGLTEMIVVTQTFHVDRAVFLCDHLGVKGYGVGSNSSGDLKASIREMPACVSALADLYILHPRPVMGRKEAI